MIEESSLDLDQSKDPKSSKTIGATIDNLDEYFSSILDDNLNLIYNEEDFKKNLSRNYHQIIRTSEQRAKFLSDYDQIKDQLSQAHKKIFSLVGDKKSENDKSDEIIKEDLSNNSDSVSSSGGDLDEKIEDYIEKKTENKKDQKITDLGAQSLKIIYFIG